jgi:hypothetical protein
LWEGQETGRRESSYRLGRHGTAYALTGRAFRA